MTPMVSLGRPDQPESFDSHNVEGITVFVRKDIKPKGDTLVISLAKLLFLKMLTVDGVDEENIYT